MTIGGYLYLSNNHANPVKQIGHYSNNVPSVLFWRWRKTYIKADGIFQEVVSHCGNVYRVQRIGETEVTYLVTDGNGKWSHGATLSEAKNDLVYKIANRDTSRYKGLSPDHEFTFEEAIECYRVITGAYSAGTRHFVEDILPKNERRERYTIREIATLTKGNYGSSTFVEFFKL